MQSEKWDEIRMIQLTRWNMIDVASAWLSKKATCLFSSILLARAVCVLSRWQFHAFPISRQWKLSWHTALTLPLILTVVDTLKSNIWEGEWKKWHIFSTREKKRQRSWKTWKSTTTSCFFFDPIYLELNNFMPGVIQQRCRFYGHFKDALFV